MISGVKTLIRNTLARAGIELRLVPRTGPTGPFPHARIEPMASYAPWYADPDFLRTYEAIKYHTLVDIYRAFGLWQLIEETAKLASGDVLEVGVWRGGTLALMAHRVGLVGIKASVIGCDTFRGVVKAGALDTRYVGGEHDDASTARVRRLLRSLAVENVELLSGIFPDETGAQLTDRTFRLCHVDVDVYASAKAATEWVWPRLVTGGVVVFDDYGCIGCEGVTRFVNECRGIPDRLFLHNLNGQALLVKR